MEDETRSVAGPLSTFGRSGAWSFGLTGDCAGEYDPRAMTQKEVRSIVIVLLAAAPMFDLSAKDTPQRDLKPAHQSSSSTIKEGGVNIAEQDGKLVIEI